MGGGGGKELGVRVLDTVVGDGHRDELRRRNIL